MAFETVLMLIAALIFAAPVALILWPDGPEYQVLERIATGDVSPDIFIGIPVRVVKEFADYPNPFVARAARVTLERRHVKH